MPANFIDYKILNKHIKESSKFQRSWSFYLERSKIMNLKQTYQNRQNQFSQEAVTLEKKYNRYSWVRLISFLAGIGLIILLGSFHILFGIGSTVLFLLGFYRFVQWHQGIKEAELHHKALATINTNEIKALDHQFDQFPHGGEFIDPLHPYVIDLDIFGPYSFFQSTNRATTAIGKKELANYLLHPADQQEILLRQEAIQELTPLLDWRQHFQAYGNNTEDEALHLKALEIWQNSENFVLNNRLTQIALYAIPLWSIFFLAFIAPFYPWFISLLCLFPAGLILLQTIKRINDAHNQTSKAGEILSKYAKLIQCIEQQNFKSPKLSQAQKVFFHDDQQASAQLSKLAYIIEQLNVRFNVFSIFLNLLGLWDLQWMTRLERWKSTNQKVLVQWFESLQTFEALNSFATSHYNNPDWSFPTISKGTDLLAKELGHPLIHPKHRITNDLMMPLEGHIKLVTGSNMAGKSTFLRTVGLNIVLAMSGAPVCAQKFELPLIQVYTSMRTQDALHESTSSFYAELKRLKFIIEAVENRTDSSYHPFFLLDEILKGTNSNDRHTGSKALIKQLIQAKGFGLIATHDLELGALEAQYDGAIENLCMEVEINDGKLKFDYKLKKGVSQSFNATILMKEMGIAIEN